MDDDEHAGHVHLAPVHGGGLFAGAVLGDLLHLGVVDVDGLLEVVGAGVLAAGDRVQLEVRAPVVLAVEEAAAVFAGVLLLVLVVTGLSVLCRQLVGTTQRKKKDSRCDVTLEVLRALERPRRAARHQALVGARGDLGHLDAVARDNGAVGHGAGEGVVAGVLRDGVLQGPGAELGADIPHGAARWRVVARGHRGRREAAVVAGRGVVAGPVALDDR